MPPILTHPHQVVGAAAFQQYLRVIRNYVEVGARDARTGIQGSF